MGKMRRSTVPMALVGTALLVVAGCSSDPEEPTPTGTAGGEDTPAPITEPIVYWSGLVGTDLLVDEWNDANPGIPVEWNNFSGSTDEQVASLLAAVDAGNAACLVMTQNDRVPSLLASGAFQDVTDYAQQYEGDYFPGTWDAVTYADVTYGLPSDTGPMAMFYRADILDELGLEAPTTWDELADVSEAVAAERPGSYFTGLPADDGQGFVSFVAQHADPWFTIEGDAWRVDVDNAGSQQVADFWQDLLDRDLVNDTQRWDPTFYNDLSEGVQLALIGGAWQAPLIAENVAGGAGEWAMAPMPTWEAGDAVTSGNGGSSILVVTGCEAPAEALEFTNWLTTNVEGALSVNIFPAVADAEIPTPDAVAEFFGGQQINADLAEYAATLRTGWGWSPTWNATQTTLGDQMLAVSNGEATLRDLLTAVQEAEVTALTGQGISVVE